jgi:polyhydroxyalkanoate synthesis regulator phasin
MKLSSRKQLLEEADEVLSEIRKSIDEFRWREHEFWTDPTRSGLALTNKRFLEAKLEKELKRIEDKYKDKNDPVSRQKEIDEVTQFIDKLRTHLSSTKRFSRNPEEQTELEKMLINTPNPTIAWATKDNLERFLVKDPKTGMYYRRTSGTPELPPEIGREYWDWVIEDTVGYMWDSNRSWFYNTLMLILKGKG